MHSNNQLIDQFNRTKTTLRISVTDQCNLRCKYCVVSSDIPFLKQENLLSFDEIDRLIKIFVNHGIDRIRITGGEPLVRPGLLPFLKKIKQAHPHVKLFMTTNGLLLEKYAQEIAKTGISTLNVSLDTTNPDKFKSITGANRLETVLSGIKAIKKYSN